MNITYFIIEDLFRTNRKSIDLTEKTELTKYFEIFLRLDSSIPYVALGAYGRYRHITDYYKFLYVVEIE